ncbi:MAG: putative ABC transport system permease protein [Rhodothermales bacterium]|jgi:putative ABC transport system permease protein
MGLFGLAALTVGRRTKEIGIRKILGASVQSVTLLVSREFAVLVVVAALIGGPLAYFGLGRWLEGFAFRVTLAPWWFLAAGLLVLIVAMATVAFHSIRAAASDPVKSLRYE